MHDFLLAKEIIDELKKIVREKNPAFVKSVSLEIGTISLAHDGHPEHTEDISISNLEFGLKSIARETVFEETEFKIKKTEGGNWRIVDIEI